MEKEDLYHDFLLIKKMKVNIYCKANMLTSLFTADPCRWRVIGITESALRKFKEKDFRYLTGIKIQRAHLKPRFQTYKQMLEMNFEGYYEWWNFYYQNDETVLAMANENRRISSVSRFPIDPSEGLFMSRNFHWIHEEKEVATLKALYDHYLAKDDKLLVTNSI